MFRYFFPDSYAKDVSDVQYGDLKSNGIVNLLFDIDNTLSPVAVPEPDVKTIDLIARLKDMGFNICLLSNGGYKRAARFAAPLGVPFVAKAGKPASKGLNNALGAIDAITANTAVIGDQIFTDILCGKRNNIYAALVRPVSGHEQWYIKLKRVLEAPVLTRYFKKQRAALKNGAPNDRAPS